MRQIVDSMRMSTDQADRSKQGARSRDDLPLSQPPCALPQILTFHVPRFPGFALFLLVPEGIVLGS